MHLHKHTHTCVPTRKHALFIPLSLCFQSQYQQVSTCQVETPLLVFVYEHA